MPQPARRLHVAPEPAPAGLDLAGLAAISEAVEAGAGLPEVVRAAARVLEASIALSDRAGAILAVAARSPEDERTLLEEDTGVTVVDLRVADETVGRLRVRARAGQPDASLQRLVATLIASEVERVRAPERASELAAATFLGAILRRPAGDPDQIAQDAAALGIDLGEGSTVVVVRAHPSASATGDWRPRALALVERCARATAPSAVAAFAERDVDHGGEVVLLVPGPLEDGRRVAAALARELEAGLPGFSFTAGRSRLAESAAQLHRAAYEALLAANVADAGSEHQAVLAFDETGAYRLLLPAMSEDPHELQRFYAETVEPLVAYDDQYETELVRTVENFLDADGNVAGTAQRLFTHRHTVRYRLERVKELSGLDVGSSDGREKLSLGLKAMRVLGIAAPGGPATEAGASGGRVRRPDATDR